jgi:hypothetical protein
MDLGLSTRISPFETGSNANYTTPLGSSVFPGKSRYIGVGRITFISRHAYSSRFPLPTLESGFLDDSGESTYCPYQGQHHLARVMSTSLIDAAG